ncbi:MAG: PQQ-dependent sugar dehydrogenase [Bacteroidota bacterium]
MSISFSAIGQSINHDYSPAPNTISKGKILFQNNCASCHNFKQQGIGPNLSGVTAQVSYEWLNRFIRNSSEMIAAGDERAARLIAQYKTPMPAHQQLKDSEIEAILAYIHQQKSPVAGQQIDAVFGTPLKDVIPAKIEFSNLTLELESWAVAPKTSNQNPFARINKMVVLNGARKRVFIEDIRGPLYEIQDKTFHTVMDLSKLVKGFINAPGLGTGFGSYAFHPGFSKNGLFYTTHTEKAGAAPADFKYADSIPVALQWVITEWKIDLAKSDSIFNGQPREFMRINMVSSMHGVQEITFNPLAKPGSADYGLLYIGVGDGGSAEGGFAQLCNSSKTIWSSVLRINPLGRNSTNGKYGIAGNNAWAVDKDKKSLGEVFARGFRNPNRITWSPDGKMLISDIGLNNVEELNIGKNGADYGWPSREGTFALNYKGKMNLVYPLPADDKGYNYPVIQYDHGEGNAFSAGFVYTGDIAELKNKYIFGDIVQGKVFYVDAKSLVPGKQSAIKEFALNFNGVPSNFKQITKNGKADLRIGAGIDGQLFLYTKTDGKLWLIKDCLKK